MKSDARGWCRTVGSDADGLQILRGGRTTCKSFWRRVNGATTVEQFEGKKSKLNCESTPKGTFPLPRMFARDYSAIIPAGLTPKLFGPSLRQHHYPGRHQFLQNSHLRPTDFLPVNMATTCPPPTQSRADKRRNLTSRPFLPCSLPPWP